MIEDFLNALQNFRLNKTRTILSLLGVIIGVASVIVITTLGQSATANIKSTYGSSGLDMVRVSSGFMRRRSSYTGLQFDETFRENLYSNIANVKKVYYCDSLSASLLYDDLSVSAQATAIENGYLEANGLELDYGSFFTVSDNVRGSQKIILGSEIAEALFPDGNPIGRTVILINSDIRFGFEVIGVLKEQTVGFETSSTSIYIPRGFYSKKISPTKIASEVVIQATSQDYASTLATAVESYAAEITGLENSVNVMSMQSFLEQYDEVMSSVSLLLSGIAAISLLVGGIGIMNIMIVTVTERKKEIGIRKALGATPKAIKMQFLIESATISLFGGFFGIIFGYILSGIVVYIMSWTFAIEWEAAVIAFAFSAMVGVFFGYNPASRAAKLDPVEALSSE